MARKKRQPMYNLAHAGKGRVPAPAPAPAPRSWAGPLLQSRSIVFNESRLWGARHTSVRCVPDYKHTPSAYTYSPNRGDVERRRSSIGAASSRPRFVLLRVVTGTGTGVARARVYAVTGTGVA